MAPGNIRRSPRSCPCTTATAKYALFGGKGNVVRLIFSIFLHEKSFCFRMLLPSKRCACTSLSLMLSPSTLSLLTQPVRNRWQPPLGKAATKKAGFHAWLLHTSPAMLLCFTSPLQRKAFINSCVRKQRALQWVAWLYH